MLDLHCHILFDVDDGAPDCETAVEMARLLAQAGFDAVAASPHSGEGPGGNVGLALAAERRRALQERLDAEGIALRLLPNAEHHVTPALFERIKQNDVTFVGGNSRWLLVELPWQPVVQPEMLMFRLQMLGCKLLLAHPERYSYVDVDALVRLAERGVKLQLELGSFCEVYGSRAQKRARTLLEGGHAHVLASDLHRPKQAEIWLAEALQHVRKRYGAAALDTGTHANPRAMVADADAESIQPMIAS